MSQENLESNVAGAHEFHWLRCLCAKGTFVDPEAGPSEDGMVEIIVECELFAEDVLHDQAQ